MIGKKGKGIYKWKWKNVSWKRIDKKRWECVKTKIWEKTEEKYEEERREKDSEVDIG